MTEILKAREVDPAAFQTREAGKYLGGFSPSTLKGWRSKGAGPRWYTTPGGTSLYRKRDLDEWLEKLAVQGDGRRGRPKSAA